jgi:hypothetical protein
MMPFSISNAPAVLPGAPQLLRGASLSALAMKLPPAADAAAAPAVGATACNDAHQAGAEHNMTSFYVV